MHDITQTELARLLDVTQSRVSRIEQGSHPPQLDTLRAFLESLGGHLEVAAVFDGERFPIDLEQAG